MNGDGPEFRNIEEILARHGELARELDGMIGGAEESVEPTAEVVETFRVRVEDYLQRVARSGVWLHSDTDRVSAVGRLSGWVNELYRLGCYRGGVRPPSVQLAPFAPDLQAELRDEDFPYAARGAAGASALVHGIWDRHVSLCMERLVRPTEAGVRWMRLLVIAGAPGSGRSSLMNEALIPVLAATPLEKGAEPPEPLKPFMPGKKPLAALAQHLVNAGLVAGRAPAAIEADLARRPAFLAEWLRSVVPPRALCIDQLEDIFTLGAPRKEQEAFVEALRNLAGDADSRHAVVVVFDSEFTGRLAQFEKFFAMAKHAWVGVNLDPNELRQLIMEPARRIGLLFEEGLAEQLVADIQGDPAAITLVQFTLRRLWQRRSRNLITWQAYQELCSGRLALDLAASETLHRFAPDDAPDRVHRVEIVRAIFLALVRPEAGGGVRVRPLSPAALDQRVARTVQQAGSGRAVKPDEIREAVGMFREERLLTDNAAGEIMLTHEALVTRWHRLVEWIEIDRAEVRHRAILRTDAEQWDAARRDPKRARGLLYPEQKLAQWRDVREQLRQDSEDADDPGYGRVVIEFLDASEAQCRRVLWRSYLRWAAVVVVVVSTFVGKYLHQRDQLNLRREKDMSLFVNHGSALLAEGDPAGALLWFAEARKQEKRGDESAEAHCMSLGIALRQLPELSGFFPTDGLVAAEISSTGTHALLARRQQGGQLGGADLWPLRKPGARPIPLVKDRTATRAVFSSDGKRAAIALGEPGESKGAIEVWDVEADPPKRIAGVDLENVPAFVQFHPKRSDLLAACWGRDSDSSGGVWRCEVSGDTIVAKPFSESAAAGAANWLAFSPNGARLAVGYTIADKGMARVFETESGTAYDTEDKGGLPPVVAVAFSNDDEGRYLAVATSTRGGDGGDARIYRWESAPADPAKDRLKRVLTPLANPEGGGVTGVFFSPKNTRLRLLTTGAGGTARIWDVAAGRQLARFAHDGWVFSAAWSPDGGTVATGSRDRFARLWNANTGDLVLPPLHHGGTLNTVRFTPDGTHLLTTTLKGARQWETQPRERSTLPVPTAGSPTATVVSTSGRLLAAAPSAGAKWGHLLLFQLGGELKPAARLDADKPVKLLAIGEHDLPAEHRRDDWIAAVTEFSDSPGSDTLLRKLLLWPVKLEADEYTWQLPAFSIPLKAEVTHLGFTGGTTPRVFIVRKPDASAEHEAAARSVVEVFDAASGERIRGPIALPFRVNATAASEDGSRLAFGGGEKRPRLGFACWLKTEGGDPPVFLKVKSTSPGREDAAHDELVAALAFSRDGAQLATGSEDDSVSVWRLPDGARIWRTLHTADVTSVSFSWKGACVLSTSLDSTAVVRAASDGRVIATVQHQGTIRSGAFSPDERYFATAGEDRSARLWGIKSGDLIAVLPHTCDVSRVSFAGDQASLITFGRRVPPASGAAEGRAASPRSMEVRRWSISKDEGSAESFTELGEFLGMREFNANQQLSLLSDPAKLERLWESYRRRAEALPEAGRAVDFHLAEARLAEASGDNASAAWHLRQSGDTPNDIDRLTDESRIFAAVGDWRRVLAASEQARSATQSEGLLQDMLEKHAEARLALGSARAESGDLGLAKPDLELALTDYRAVADRDPKGAYWRTQQAEALTLLKRYPEAIAALDEAIRLNASPGHFQKKASIHLRLGDTAAYEEDCKAALARFPDGEKHTSAIWCCLLDALPGFDLASLAPGVKKVSSSYEQRNTLGALLYRLGGTENTEQSIDMLGESVRLFERSPLRQRRDVYAVDASLPEGRPVDWIFLAMAHLRRAADDTLSQPERDRHLKRGLTYRDAVDKVLVKGGPLGEFGSGAIAWKRLELEVLRAGCDRDFPR